MGKKLFNILTFLGISFFLVNHVEAIGGRGGGARGQGTRGRAQGTRAQQFADVPSPTMSRADVRPRQSGQTDIQQRMSVQSNPAVTRSQLQQYVQAPNAGRTAVGNLPQLNQANARSAAQTLGQFNQQHPNANNWFNGSFFSQHDLNPNYYASNANLWRNAGWASTAAWVGLGAYAGGYPAYYYDADGSSTNLTPEEAVIYSPQENVVVMPPQTAQTATSNQVSSTSLAVGDWLPLGVFAVGSGIEEAPYSNMIMQISLNKAGYISGTYYNAATDQAYPMEGMVDKKTQEAIWKMSDSPESPVAWTGLYNLTQDVVNIQVNFPNGTAQAKVLVRLKN